MDNWVFYIIIGLVILSLFSNQTQENFQNINIFPPARGYNPFGLGFSYNPYWSIWTSPWNQPTRFPRLFYDIRGDPNIVYRHYMLGGYVPYGYMFGPYLYDSQGKLLYDSKKPHYIA
jgi:hypothetical protein